MVTAAPEAELGTERQQWVDTLRVALIAGVIVVHTATGYVTDFAGWYYDDEVEPDAILSLLLAGPALLGGIYGLGPLFLLAGWFSVRSLGRRGPAGFAASRLVRLGIPLLIFVMLVNPLADYLGNWWQEGHSFRTYLAMTEFSVMWFVVALLACSLGYAALRSVRPAPATHPPLDGWTLVGAAAVIAAGSLLVWQTYNLTDTHWMNVRLSAWIQAVVLYALGVAAAEAGRPVTVPRPIERRLGIVLAVGLVLTLGLLLAAGVGADIGDALVGVTWWSVSFAVLYGAVSVVFTLWCVSWVARRWPTHGQLMERAGRGSYAAYVTHPLWLTLLMLAFGVVALAPVVKFVVVAAVAIPVCFSIGYGITRLPVLRRVF